VDGCREPSPRLLLLQQTFRPHAASAGAQAAATLSLVRGRPVAIVATAATALVAAAQAQARPLTTAPPAEVVVRVTVSDHTIQMKPKVAQRGTIAHFVLVNTGTKPHTFALGHLEHASGKQTGFVKSLRPHEQATLLLFLDYRGALAYRGTLPADLKKAAMKGTFRII
jgi:hypothetical protein